MKIQGAVFVLFLSACESPVVLRKVSLCEFAQKADWVTRGEVSSWSPGTRTVPWSGGPPLKVTDATFVADENLIGSGGTDVLLDGPVSLSGSMRYGAQLRNSDGSPRTLLFFFRQLEDEGPIAGGAIFEAIDGAYTFDDQVVQVEDIQSAIEAYREPTHVCVTVNDWL